MNSKVQIEKGIPIPTSVKARRPKYPWMDMEVGDSFFANTKGAPGVPKPVRDAGRKYIARLDGEGEAIGWRVWRIA